MRALVLPLLLLLFPPLAWAPTLASAQERLRHEGSVLDTWSEPNPGVRYLRRTSESPAVSIHALVVDLDRDGVRLVATPEAERWDSISGFAQRRGAVAAINGGFWGMMQRPSGVTAGDGELWSGSEANAEFGHFALLRDGRAAVFAPGEGEDERSLARLDGALSGRPILVHAGAPALEILDAFGTANLRQPRTAVGVSRDGRTVVLAVADGRQAHSSGLTLYQLARLVVELGAHRAINLDGGGSSAMYVERAGGLVSSPARGRWASVLGLEEDPTLRRRRRGGAREVYVRGLEREVMNHLAVLAPDVAVDVAGADDGVLLDGLGHLDRRRPPVAFAAGRPPVRLGRLREWLFPGLGALAALACLLALVRLGRWGAHRARRAFAQTHAARRARSLPLGPCASPSPSPRACSS